MSLRIEMHPLGEFIDNQIKERRFVDEAYSDTRFAKDVGVDKGTISLWLSENPPKSPSYKLLTGLARATKTDICAIVAMVAPELTRTNSRRAIVEGLIADLTDDELGDLDTQLLALKLKREKQSK